GRLSTGFIAEEYPDGFQPREPEEGEKTVLAAIAVAVELVRRDRLDRLPGRLAPHSGRVKSEWVVRIGDEYLPVRVAGGAVCNPFRVELGAGDGEPVTVASDWRPGEIVWRGTVGDRGV